MVNPIKSSLVRTTMLLSFLVFAFSCLSPHMEAPAQPFASEPIRQSASRPPQIEDSFAVSSLWQGQIWRIYIKGSDPDGDMDHIWVVVTQLGGNTANDIIPLYGNDRRAFSGYLALFTPHSIGLWETVRVEIKIKDKAVNYSLLCTHETRIGSPTTETLPHEWAQVADKELGVLPFDFDLRNETRDHDD